MLLTVNLHPYNMEQARKMLIENMPHPVRVEVQVDMVQLDPALKALS